MWPIKFISLSVQNKDVGESDSEKEQEEMNELENLLKKHDPSFAKYVTRHDRNSYIIQLY